MKTIQKYSPPQFNPFPGVKDIPLVTGKVAGALVDSVSSDNERYIVKGMFCS
jgi:hypothetical protein